MDIKKRYRHISSYLEQTREIWAYEVLEYDPSSWGPSFQQMLEEVSKLSHYNKWKVLTQRSSHKSIPLSYQLHRHLNDRQKLTELPYVPSQKVLKLPSWAFKKVRYKKQHEISVLAQVLDDIRNRLGPSRLIDIGGGQGHFARVMAHYFNWATTSIDKDPKLIELGTQRLNKYPAPKEAAALNLKHINFCGPQEDVDKQDVEVLFPKDCFSLGLHTCGSLAVRHLQTHQYYQTKGMLNFGCCYGKIQDGKDLNLSQISDASPIKWSTPALNLAARSHAQLSYAEFCMHERVKSYRYALDLFLKSHFPHEDLPSVGTAPRKSYLAPFTKYARLKFDDLNKNWTPALERELNDFYYSYQTRQQIEFLFSADILRWSFGRLLELGLLLDRALFISQDIKQKVELAQFFDESISPRNIGLMAYREELAD